MPSSISLHQLKVTANIHRQTRDFCNEKLTALTFGCRVHATCVRRWRANPIRLHALHCVSACAACAYTACEDKELQTLSVDGRVSSLLRRATRRHGVHLTAALSGVTLEPCECRRHRRASSVQPSLLVPSGLSFASAQLCRPTLFCCHGLVKSISTIFCTPLPVSQRVDSRKIQNAKMRTNAGYCSVSSRNGNICINH